MIRVHSKSDLPERGPAPKGSVAVSAVTADGLERLLDSISEQAKSILPAEDAIALNRRQAGHIAEAADAIGVAASADDIVIIAENLRQARSAFDRLTGRAGVEQVLDAVFSRFCLGK